MYSTYLSAYPLSRLVQKESGKGNEYLLTSFAYYLLEHRLRPNPPHRPRARRAGHQGALASAGGAGGPEPEAGGARAGDRAVPGDRRDEPGQRR